MAEENRTINSELRKTARDIIENGICSTNYESVINLLQSIVECNDDTVFADQDFSFLIVALYYVKTDSPLLELLINNIRDRFLYFQYIKLDNTAAKPNPDDIWLLTRVTEEDPVTNKKYLITYNVNQATGEQIELYKTELLDPSEEDIDSVFTNLLSIDDSDKLERSGL